MKLPPGALSRGSSGSSSPGLWSCCCRGTAKDLSAEVEMGTALSLPLPDRFSASSQGWEARAAFFSAPIEAQTLQLSDSDELDVVSANARDTEDSPPQSRAYEELVKVVTRAVEKLSIDWPAERSSRSFKRQLDERFLPSHAQPQHRGFAIFVHTEVWRSWGRPVSYRVYSTQTSHYSSIYSIKKSMVMKRCLRGEIALELSSYPLDPRYYSLSQWERHQHWWERLIQRLVRQQHVYTLSLLQAYQAELLADLDEGKGIGPNAVCELRRATDMSLRAA